MRVPCFLYIITPLLAIFTAHYAVSAGTIVQGPVELESETGAPEDGAQASLSSQPDDFGKILFAKLGIRVLPPKATGASQTPLAPEEAIRQMIASGVRDEQELLEGVRERSAVAIDHVIIDLSRQRLYLVNHNNEILEEFLISSGTRGFETPPGEYRIVNKAHYAYSKKYQADMYNWMGLTANGDYGLHSLKGSSYERHLGRRASHGCIRLSRKDASILYSLLPIGTRVRVVNRLEPVKYFQALTTEQLKQKIASLLTEYPELPYF